MDRESLREMRRNLNQWYADDLEKEFTIVDIGSYDVNGTYKKIVPPAWKYIGLDRIKGPNVDKVMLSDYVLPIPPNSVDVFISGSCFHYVRNPFRLMREIKMCLKPEGMVFICAAHTESEGLISLPEELCPNQDASFDCWRFLKDGMAAVIDDADLIIIQTYYHGSNCWGIGRKSKEKETVYESFRSD